MNLIKSFLLTAAVSITAGVQADFSLNSSVFSSGGGPSSGGSFSLNSTLGQPDAGGLSGGNFVLTGGFWPGSATVPSGPPALSIRLGGAHTVILSWPSPSIGSVLQQTANMNAPGGGWTDVAQVPNVIGSNKEVTLPATGRFCLFRLRAP